MHKIVSLKKSAMDECMVGVSKLGKHLLAVEVSKLKRRTISTV
jgi:hypothetical protein